MSNIFSGIKKKILNYLFLNEERRVYINEFARILESDPKNVYRSLVALEKEGILSSEFMGKQRYFYLNKKNKLFKEHKNIFLKTVGIESVLKEELKKVAGLKNAYIFGSYANKNYGPDSDIDILLIGAHKALHAQKTLYNIQKHAGRDINTVNMPFDEFEKKRMSGDNFIKNIFNGKVIKLL